jgi:YidC/Oxa1 family membrane protein insertase
MNQPKNPLEQKNFLAAVLISMAIIFGWQFFYVAPQMKEAEQLAKQQQATQTAPGATAQPGTTPALTSAASVVTRDAALAASTRIAIDTPDVDGTINLKGAVLDDLRLKKYRETVDKTSPEIVLLSPSGTKNAYFVRHFLALPAGMTGKVPDDKTVWSADTDAKLGIDAPVRLTWDNGEGLLFVREISISDKYVFQVKQTVENKSQAPLVVFPYAQVQREDTPLIAGWYVFYEGMIGIHNGTLTEVGYADVAKADGTVTVPSTGGWLGFTDKYWSTALMPDVKTQVANTYKHVKDGNRDIYQAEYITSAPLTVAPGGSATYVDHVFAGVKEVGTVNTIGDKLGVDTFDRMIDWGWFPYLTKPMFWLLSTLNALVGNFGIAILLATVVVKLLIFPLANKQFVSMSKLKLLQPEMERLKAQHGDDRTAMQKDMMELYKREKVSPVSGCLPIFVQIPVFFALYKVILTTIELRHAPFFGWIQDLSAPDPTSMFNLFGLLPFSVPQILLIGIWPLLMGITMWVQMRLNPAPADPIQASLFNWMPVIFTFTLGGFPAGLVIYWAWSNLLTILQQSYIMKRNGVEVDIFGNIKDSLPFLKKKTAQ